MANDRMVLVDLYTEARVRIPLAIQQVTPTMQQEVPNIMDILPPLKRYQLKDQILDVLKGEVCCRFLRAWA
jgi:hypothetical protein